MKKKIIGIFVCTLLLVATHGIATQSIISNQQNKTTSNEPIIIKPLPVKKVKEIPVPWQFWEEFPQEGVLSVIVLPENVSAVAIVRAYVRLSLEKELEIIHWDHTMGMNMIQIDNPSEPYILEPGGQVEYFIPTTPYHKAVIVRYSVALADTPDVIIGHFISEIILESRYSLSLFDFHNDYSKSINNFELELYGNIVPNDVIYWYGINSSITMGNSSYGPCWVGGWGTPPQINNQSYGIEMIWKDKKRPVKTGEWVYFGLILKPDVTITGAKAYWTITKSIDLKGDYKISSNLLILRYLGQHQNLFPVIQKILNRLGQ